MISQSHIHGQTSSPPHASLQFPSVVELEANPHLLLQPPRRPTWCHSATLLSRGIEGGMILQPSDLPLAVSAYLKCGESLPVTMDYWDFAYLAALSRLGGYVRPNPAKKMGKDYIRFKPSGSTLHCRQFPVGRILLKLTNYEIVKHLDGNLRNLLRSNLKAVSGWAQRDARQAIERYQIERAGERGEDLALSLNAITEHHERLLASIPVPATT